MQRHPYIDRKLEEQDHLDNIQRDEVDIDKGITHFLDSEKLEEEQLIKESRDYCRLVLREMFSRLTSKLDELQATNNEDMFDDFLNSLCSVEESEEALPDYKLSENGTFIKNQNKVIETV